MFYQCECKFVLAIAVTYLVAGTLAENPNDERRWMGIDNESDQVS